MKTIVCQFKVSKWISVCITIGLSLLKLGPSWQRSELISFRVSILNYHVLVNQLLKFFTDQSLSLAFFDNIKSPSQYFF